MSAQNEIKVILADDHQMIRDGIKSLLEDEAIKIVGEANNGEKVLELLQEKTADLVIMDINMPEMDGIEATKQIVKKHSGVKVLALSMFDDESYIVNMLEVGAAGYILKNTGQEELVKAITAVADGENYFSDKVSSKLLNQFIKNKGQPTSGSSNKNRDAPVEHLTKREKEVLKLIAEENTNKEIAEKLFISPRTVDTHRRNLLQKLNVKNTAGLVRYAMKHDILE
jgi:DNA-binding NarL/FixJ family response regulator